VRRALRRGSDLAWWLSCRVERWRGRDGFCGGEVGVVEDEESESNS
jgi:hypothetical protein